MKYQIGSDRTLYIPVILENLYLDFTSKSEKNVYKLGRTALPVISPGSRTRVWVRVKTFGIQTNSIMSILNNSESISILTIPPPKVLPYIDIPGHFDFAQLTSSNSGPKILAVHGRVCIGSSNSIDYD